MFKSTFLGADIAAMFFLLAIGAELAAGMGMEKFGPAGEHIGRSSDWPQGVEDLLRHPSRVYWQWVNGSERAYYDGDLAAINELLALYSRVELTEHPVVLLAEKRKAESFHGKSTPYLVEFQIPGKLETNARQRDGTAGLYPNAPRLIIAIDGKLAERLNELVIPTNVTLQTSRQQLTTSNDSIDPRLSERLRDFVEKHGRRVQVTEPQNGK